MDRFDRTALTCLCVVAGILAAAGGPAVAADDATVVLEFTQPQTAVLDGANWDKVFANEKYFDALRPMLVRFPGLADKVYEKLREGYQVEKAQLLLTWQKQEDGRPERGRGNWGAPEMYKKDPGQWHAIVYPLRKPWSVDDANLGPTFNAYINGLAFWDRGGGRGDGNDRGAVLGPQPLHAAAPVAAFDVTALLTDANAGGTVGARLRAIEDRGFEVRKLEIRDMKYRNFYAYDWCVNIGYMKIWADPIKLAITMKKAAPAEPGQLPPAADIPAMAARLRQSGPLGQPSIYYPKDLHQRAARHFQKPPGMPDWQWQRLNELFRLHADPDDGEVFLGRGYNFAVLFEANQRQYLAAMREIMLTPPRTWLGHLTSDWALLADVYADLLPPGVVDHLQVFWQAWLHPEVANRDDVGGGVHRGGPTYFRGYTHGGGTQNFGHNAVMGALLAGQFLQAPYVLRDARGGVQHLSRYWGLGTGACQEIGDTYYLALTLGAAGAIGQYAEDPVDRLTGRFHRDRLVESQISMYHGGLRRTTHPMGRGFYCYQIGFQEGSYHILHSLSPQGVLMNLEDLKPSPEPRSILAKLAAVSIPGESNVAPPSRSASQPEARMGFWGQPDTWGEVDGLHILGNEGPPMRMALLGPWTEPYLADAIGHVVDVKPPPWRVFARDFSPGMRSGWHVNYLGAHYALASRDNAGRDYGIYSAVAQWRRTPARIAKMQELSTMFLSAGTSRRFQNNMGSYNIVQRDGKLLAMFEKPQPEWIFEPNKPTRSLHATLNLIALGDVSGRELWINDERADAVSRVADEPNHDWKKYWSYLGLESAGASVLAKDGDRITISDGVTYVGLIPVTANALGRSRQVEITYEHPAMLIHTYAYCGEESLDPNTYQEAMPMAGYVIEVGDANEYADFAAFRRHMKECKLTAAWDANARLLNLSYVSGADVLEMAANPLGPSPMRRVNGQWPYIPEGVMRESTWSIQGDTGRLEKLGAVLAGEKGHQTYLLVPPGRETYIGYNPLPDPISWSLSVPGGIEVRADGKLGITRVVVRASDNRIWVDHADRLEQNGPEIADALLVYGAKAAPTVVLNDQPLAAPTTVEIDGRSAYVIPLRGKVPTKEEIVQRMAKAAAPAPAAEEVRDPFLAPASATAPANAK